MAPWLVVWLALVAPVAPAWGQDDSGARTKASKAFDESIGDTSEIDSCRSDENLAEDTAQSLASEHFVRGVKLYEQGDYEAAIDEFVRAYCHKPLPIVLKNIAQAYERLVQYEKAVAYLERYIYDEDNDEVRQVQSARVQVLRNLPARVRIATNPPGAAVTLTSTDGVRRAGFSNAKEPLKLPRGRYTMTIDMAGFELIEDVIDVQIGQPYSFYYQLEPKKGTLRVVSTPPSARVFVDKQWVGLGTYIDQLPIGNYMVRAEAPGRLPQSRELEIIAGGNKNVSFDLQKKPRSGRGELLLAAGIGGLVWGGGTLATIFSEDAILGSIGGAVGLGVGFGSAYVGVPRDVTVGESSYIVGTTLIGMAEAGLIASLLSCGSEPQADGSYERSGCESGLIAGTTLAGGAAGLLFSSLTASQLKLDAGDAAIINSGALWGSISGALLWVVFGNDVRLDEVLIGGGLNVGIITGALLANRYKVSRGHVALIDLSGLTGLVVAASFVDVADQDEGISERVPNFALLGMTVGLLTGAFFTRHMDEPKSLGVLNPSVGTARDASGKTSLTVGFHGQF